MDAAEPIHTLADPHLQPHVFPCRLQRGGGDEPHELRTAALRQDLKKARIELPRRFTFEITYRQPKDAVKNSFYPGFKMVDDLTIRMVTSDYMNVLRAAWFCL